MSAKLSYWDGTQETHLNELNFTYKNGSLEKAFDANYRLSYWAPSASNPAVYTERHLLPEFSQYATDVLDLSNYNLTFEEQFNTASWTTSSPKLGATWYAPNWISRSSSNSYPPVGQEGWFGDGSFDVSRMSVSGGVLHNQAYKHPTDPGVWGKYWRGGALTSVDRSGAGFSQMYGYFEARMQMPDSGNGTWPAFWLLSKNNIDAVNGKQTTNWLEIDILEWYGIWRDQNKAIAQQASHNWKKPAGGSSQKTTGQTYLYDPDCPMPNTTVKPWQGYHTYGVLVDPICVTWYIDGIKTNQIYIPTIYHTAPLYIELNYAFGGGWPLTGVVDGSELLVDYVKVWALPS